MSSHQAVPGLILWSDVERMLADPEIDRVIYSEEDYFVFRRYKDRIVCLRHWGGCIDLRIHWVQPVRFWDQADQVDFDPIQWELAKQLLHELFPEEVMADLL